MNPKDFASNERVNEIKSHWMQLKPAHKAAISIAALTLIWMLSGIFSFDLGGDVTPTVTHQTPRVQVYASKAIQHTRTVAVYGQVKADRAVSLLSKFDATVADVQVPKGSMVKEGDVIIRFQSEGRAERLAEAEARLLQAEISFDAASKLGKEGFRSKINTAGAKADLEAAMAAVATAKSNFDNATIRAPFSGIVDSIPVEVGDVVTKGRVAARIIDITRLKVTAEVAERDAGNIAVGGTSNVNLMDKRTLDGVVTYVSRASSESTRTYTVEVSVDVPDMSVAEGLTAELVLPMETVSAHIVSPAILTLNDDGQLGVKTVSDDNLVMFYPVKMVSDTRNGIWISGIGEVANFIVVGQEFVQVGQKVEAIPMLSPAEMTNGKVEGM
ncbi:MAG: efflux RND transporter periplasmic adaptor subunit [Rhodospirillaceae bacterium]|nr:efflux RND transporter periplasmic adaptor subunit [Rhodospirillaceae bacterium]